MYLYIQIVLSLLNKEINELLFCSVEIKRGILDPIIDAPPE